MELMEKDKTNAITKIKQKHVKKPKLILIASATQEKRDEKMLGES